jgi:hypothetical protein
MGGVFRRFLRDLFAGDPVALTCAAVLAVMAALLGLVWLKTAYDLKKDDEKRTRGRRR